MRAYKHPKRLPQNGGVTNQVEQQRHALAEQEEMVEAILALSPEQFAGLSAAARMAHRIRLSLVSELKQELAAVEAAEVGNQGGAQ